MKYIKNIGTGGAVLILTLIIGLLIRGSEAGILFDEKIMNYVHIRITPTGISLMNKVSFLGSTYFLFILVSLILIIMIKRKNIKAIRLLLLSSLGSVVLNSILKEIFIRTRPLKYFLIEQGGYSFPSGHAMVSMSFYTTMAYLLSKNCEKGIKRNILWLFNFIIIAAIGFSRIYLGVHWPTDVLAGYILGYMVYYLITSLTYKELKQ